MLKLSPVMSSMFMVVQTPVVSASQAMWQVEPSLNTSPGPGVEGLGSAWTAAAARTVARKMEDNIVMCGRGMTRRVCYATGMDKPARNTISTDYHYPQLSSVRVF